MKAQFKIVDPDEMECSLTMTMKLSEWKKLQKQLSESYPSWKLSRFITDMVLNATKIFNDEIKEVED